MSRPTTATTTGVGRPRRFDDETERRMVMDAAMKVMAHNGYAEMSVGGVLSEAGLSTRAFYRHFDSREALLVALIRRDAESVRRSLERSVNLATDPVSALEAWLERYLDVFYEPRRAARTALFSSPAIRSSLPLAEVVHEMQVILCRPLVGLLRSGHESGVLYAPTPESDANSLFVLVRAATDRHQPQFPDRHSARAHVMRFAWPAFGLSTGGAPAVSELGSVRVPK